MPAALGMERAGEPEAEGLEGKYVSKGDWFSFIHLIMLMVKSLPLMVMVIIDGDVR